MILPTTCCVRQVARARKDAEAQTLGQRRCGSLICGSLICLHNSHQDDTKLTSGSVKHDGQDRSEEAKKASQEASRLRERLGKAGVQATKSTAASKSTAGSSAPQNVAKQTASAAPAPRAPEAEAKAAESITGGASNGAPPPLRKSNSVRRLVASPCCACCVCCTCCPCSLLLLHAPRVCLPCAARPRHNESEKTP